MRGVQGLGAERRRKNGKGGVLAQLTHMAGYQRLGEKGGGGEREAE